MSDSAGRSVAIIGSGPGGIYVAQALIEKAPGIQIDIIDRLPTPFGLVRGGVAPDHQSTKKVDRKYAESMTTAGVRFLGNVELGRDVSLNDLEGIYDAIVLAYGAPYDKTLGIPGEDKKNVFGSNAFVGWYNCHPDFRALNPDIDVAGAVVIGVGNVAVDVARVLSRTVAEMAKTDIADYAADCIEASRLQDIWMFGRRGPVEAAFTNVELKELGEMQDATADVDPAQIPESLPDSVPESDRRVKGRILETLRAIGGPKPRDKRRAIHIRFYAMPVEILGGDRVEAIRMERTRVENGRTVGTGETFDLPCGLVVTCIGSRAQPIDGVPFDDRQGIAIHTDGRIKSRVYCAGWLKRGAIGTIGTNRLDSYAVTDLLLSEFAGPPRPGPAKLDELLRTRKIHPVGFDDWLIIKRLEEEAAEGPAPRRKFDSIMSMLHALDTVRSKS